MASCPLGSSPNRFDTRENDLASDFMKKLQKRKSVDDGLTYLIKTEKFDVSCCRQDKTRQSRVTTNRETRATPLHLWHGSVDEDQHEHGAPQLNSTPCVGHHENNIHMRVYDMTISHFDTYVRTERTAMECAMTTGGVRPLFSTAAATPA